MYEASLCFDSRPCRHLFLGFPYWFRDDIRVVDFEMEKGFWLNCIADCYVIIQFGRSVLHEMIKVLIHHIGS